MLADSIPATLSINGNLGALRVWAARVHIIVVAACLEELGRGTVDKIETGCQAWASQDKARRARIPPEPGVVAHDFKSKEGEGEPQKATVPRVPMGGSPL